MKNVWPYRVDGEVGRIEFPTYRVVHGERVRYDAARELFAPLGCWERYETVGFKEIAFMYGITEQSCRKTTVLINRLRHQEGATGATTLRTSAERAGKQVMACLDQTTTTILQREGFDTAGQPLTPRFIGSHAPVVISPQQVTEAIDACDLTADEGAEVERNPVPYEHAAETVNVSIDDVVVKQQKQRRANGTQAPAILAPEETSSGRKYVHDTIAHIQHQERSYCIAGPSVPAVLRILVGYLLTNGLLGDRLQFFVDGQKTLQAAIFKAFAWLGKIGMILDWYHLEDKCARQLRLAMKGAALRNEALTELASLLWYGRVASAKTFLQHLPAAHLKNPDEIQVLIAYLERNRPLIPCYGVRKRLGLRNSSNIGEKMNDLLVSDRQKHHGMSWSAGGSIALAALEALKRNNEYQHWFEFHEIELKQAA